MSRPLRYKSVANTGFSANSSTEGARLVGKDGSTHLRKVGIPLWERISIYHTLLRMSRWRFLALIFIFYTSINLVFAATYYLIGVKYLSGTETAVTHTAQFLEAFFFSAQTLTTVGYGHVAPMGALTNSVASFESLLGILVFALVTGIFYGRFSRPRAYIMFSPQIIIAPFKDGTALMFRLATYKNNHLTDVEAQVTGALHIDEGGNKLTRFFPLPLEIGKINSLALSWTIVHPIDADSPLYGCSHQDLINRKLEVIVAIKGFDDHFSNTVQQRTSFNHEELEYGARFLPMYVRSTDARDTILDMQKLGVTEKVGLPATPVAESAGEEAAAINA